MRVRFFVAACGLAGLVALAGCGPSRVAGPGPSVQPEVIDPGPVDPSGKVGLLLPLSGPAAALGQDMLNAAQMALFDVGDNDLVLLPRDTGGSAADARRAADAVIAEGASLILGPLFSQAVQATTPVAATVEVPVLAFSNVSAVADPPTFILGFRPEEQVRRIVRYARAQGLERIAGLAPDDPYGMTAMNALQEAVVAEGGELGPILFYPPDLADPSGVVRETADYDRRQAALEREKARVAAEEASPEAALRQLETRDTFGPPPFDAILIADGGARLRSVAALLTFYDVSPAEVRFLGTMRWQDDPLVLEESALQGGWFAGPSPDRAQAFDARYERAFGSPPQQLAGLAYDATALAVIASRDLADPTFTVETLTTRQGFEGATGLFRLRPDGLTDHGLAVLEIGGGAASMIDPPPDRFEDLVVTTTPPARPGIPPAIPGVEPVPGGATPTAPVERVIVPDRAPPSTTPPSATPPSGTPPSGTPAPAPSATF